MPLKQNMPRAVLVVINQRAAYVNFHRKPGSLDHKSVTGSHPMRQCPPEMRYLIKRIHENRMDPFVSKSMLLTCKINEKINQIVIFDRYVRYVHLLVKTLLWSWSRSQMAYSLALVSRDFIAMILFSGDVVKELKHRRLKGSVNEALTGQQELGRR